MANISFALFLLYAFFSDLIIALTGSNLFRYSLWTLTIITVLGASARKGKIYASKIMVVTVCVVIFFVFLRNEAFANSDYMTTIRWTYCFIYCFFATNLKEKFSDVLVYVANIGFIHVIATYIFLVIPSAYSKMYSVWGYWPSGTSGGQFGYKAGITNHYSHNGIVLAVTYLALFAMIFKYKNFGKKLTKKENKKLKQYIIMFLLTFWAVILTTKRAHLVFGILAMLIVYYFCKPESMSNKTFKIIVFGLAGVVGISIAGNFIPAIGNVLSRFSSSISEDSTMISRIRFWELAIQMFLAKPIIGYGWFSFRYQYRTYLYDTSVRSARYELLDCHNVYLQVLAESGIIGFAFYAIIIGYVSINTFQMLRKNSEELNRCNMLAPLLFSGCLQVFYLTYSLTGNCLYDITSAFYMLAAAITVSCKFMLRKRESIIECK